MNSQTPFLYIFKHSSRYQFKKPLGKGAYGYVCSALDTHTNQEIAIKKISNLNNPLILLRTLREIKLLKHFRNVDNIINIKHAILPDTKNFDEIFFVQECMEADLHYIIYSKQSLSNEHVKFLLYQLINGLNYIHKAGVIHRDLKPSNCLVNSKCRLKICDFGLARENVGEDVAMSSYVQTRWYRAPELLFKSHCYTNKVDIWSVGCIFAELVLREPFIQGTNSQDQIEKMIYVLGTPPQEIISKIEFNEIRFFIENLIFKKEIDFKKVFTSLSKCAISLLKKLLDYKITDRISAEEALKHSFFTSIAKHKEFEVNELNDYAEIGKNIYEMKKDLYNELLDFYKDDEIEKTAVIDSESILK